MTNETNPGTVESKNLSELLAWARNWMDTASPEEKAAMWQAQRESWSKGPHGPTDGMGTVYVAAQSQPAATVQEVDWLKSRVVEVMEDDGGCWRACSGCQESVDGYVSTKDYPRSAIFKCQPGSGCRECGGIGVIYDDGGFLAGYGAALTAEPAAKAGDAEDLWNRIADIIAERVSSPNIWEDHLKIAHRLDQLEAAKDIAKLFTQPSPQPDMESKDAVIAAIDGERLVDHTDHPEDAAYNRAIDDAIAAVRALSPPASQSVEKIREALQLAKEALDLAHPYVADVVKEDGGIDHCDIAYRMDLEKIEAASAALSTLPHKEEATPVTQVEGLREALKGALEWIDAIPADVVANLPAMPGFDRDRVDELIAATTERGNG